MHANVDIIGTLETNMLDTGRNAEVAYFISENESLLEVLIVNVFTHYDCPETGELQSRTKK